MIGYNKYSGFMQRRLMALPCTGDTPSSPPLRCDWSRNFQISAPARVWILDIVIVISKF